MLVGAGQQASLGQEDWPQQGHLQFCGVSLRYGSGLPDALDGVSFELRPGQKVGICGRTGQSDLLNTYTPLHFSVTQCRLAMIHQAASHSVWFTSAHIVHPHCCAYAFLLTRSFFFLKLYTAVL